MPHHLRSRAVAILLAATISIAPACRPNLTISSFGLTPGPDELGGLGHAVFAALQARRDAPAPPPLELAPTDDAGTDPSTPNPLTLTAIVADIVVEGPLAYTQLALTFTNPDQRVREGRFAITLPTDAAIGRFALHTSAGWREAEVVSKQRARVVYESYLHRGVDPALLEQASANTFAARVFPVAAKANTEIVIGYSQEATPERPARLALHGLPRVGAVTIRIHRGDDVEVRTRRDVTPDDVMIEVSASPAAVAAGTDFVARVPVAAASDPVPMASVYVLVDTSASRAGLVGPQVAALRALVDELDDDAAVTIATFDQRVRELYRGRAGEVAAMVLDAVVSRGALGASDLAAGLAAAARSGMERVVVIGDAVATAGETGAGALAKLVHEAGVLRVDVLQLGDSLDAVVAEALVTAGRERGAVLRVEAGVTDGLARRLTVPTAAPAVIAIEDATWSWPRSSAGVAGSEVVVYGRRAAGAADRPLRITVGTRAHVITPVAGTDALVQRAVARADLGVLAMKAAATTDPAERARLAGSARALALHHRLVSAETSLLVLERDEDYAEFCLTQDQLPDLLVVDGTRGLQRRARKPPAIAPAAACATQAAATPAGSTGDEAFDTVASVLAARHQVEAERAEAEAAELAEDARRDAAEAASERDRHAARNARADRRRAAAERDGARVHGMVTDRKTGDPVYGATVAARAFGGGTASAITDELGAYLLAGVAAGSITVTAYYGDHEVRRKVRTRAKQERELSFRIDTQFSGGETIRIESRAPIVDQGSTRTGITISQDYTANIPTSRTFEGALGSEAGSQGDGVTCECDSMEPPPLPPPPPPPPPPPSPSQPPPSSLSPSSSPSETAPTAAASDPDPDAARPRRVVMLSPDRNGFGRGATIPTGNQTAVPREGVIEDALAAIDRGDRTGALDRAARAQIAAPADVGALLALGIAAESTGALALAARAYGSLIDLFPGQAELVRTAAVRLERLGPDGLALALDGYARAAADRPDQLHGMRLWAWARARAGDLEGAFAVIERALAIRARHAGEVAPAFAADLGVLAAVIAAADPARRPALAARLSELGVQWPTTSTTRAFLTWETDANDVDLHVMDRAGGHAFYGSRFLATGGELLADITRGYGPEVFVPTAADGPLRLAAHYYSRGPMGIGLGALQVINHDADAGIVTVELRPFALLRDQAVVDLGTLPGGK